MRNTPPFSGIKKLEKHVCENKINQREFIINKMYNARPEGARDKEAEALSGGESLLSISSLMRLSAYLAACRRKQALCAELS